MMTQPSERDTSSGERPSFEESGRSAYGLTTPPSQPTPGPWMPKDIETSFGRGKRRLLGPGDVNVAHVLCPASMTVDTYEANARLIAAAPELLDLLTRVVADPWDNDQRDKARALLARIEGKEAP